MDLGKSFVAHSKTMEIMEPSMSTFDYPSIFSEATAVLGAAPRKNGFEAQMLTRMGRPPQAAFQVVLCRLWGSFRAIEWPLPVVHRSSRTFKNNFMHKRSMLPGQDLKHAATINH